MLVAVGQVQALDEERAYSAMEEISLEDSPSQSKQQKTYRANIATMTLVIGFVLMGACFIYGAGQQPAGDSTTKRVSHMAFPVPHEVRSTVELERRLAPYGAASTGKTMNIVFVTAEVAPWSITGGLGAVCDGLPRALAKMGHRVMSIAPRYDQYFDAWDTEFTAQVPVGEEVTTVRFFHSFKKGVDRVFVDHPLFLERVWGHSKQKLYGPKWGKDYEDNQLRFSMFCKAAMIATEKLKLGGSVYGTDVTFVANDWHAALLPMYLQQAKKSGSWSSAKSVVLLHNLVFQGRFPKESRASERLGLNEDIVDSMTVTQSLTIGRGQKEEPVLNFVMGAIKAADTCITVSPRYAKEVATTGDKGAGLQVLLAKKGVKGILNGVEDIVRPDNAELGLRNTYDKNTLDQKVQVKMAMQKALGFDVDASTPMFIFLGRLDYQKGVDVMFQAINKALKGGLNAQFITMGSGMEDFEETAAQLEERFASNFRAVLSFKGTEKYRTYAAADFAVMPSRYEPCGLVQMEGMRFGTLPIVTPTGGLMDTVTDGKTGIVMEHEVNMEGLVQTDVDMLANSFARAAELMKSAQMRSMQVAAMEAADEYSWSNSAKQYVQAFSGLRV